MKYIWAFILLLGCLTVSTYAEAENILLTAQEDGQTISVNQSDTVTIKLYSNPTTGYSWQFSLASDDVLTPTQDSFVPPPPSDMVGVGGFHIYKVQAVKQGTATITGRYFRPWEQFSEQQDKSVIYHIIVK